jgi:hypothetical protein
MNDEEPHAITDEEPSGEATKTYCSIRVAKLRKIIVPVSFDNMQEEFDLWNYIYDLRQDTTAEFEFETTPDYKNRIQYYEITAQIKTINTLRRWLTKNKFNYKFDK